VRVASKPRNPQIRTPVVRAGVIISGIPSEVLGWHVWAGDTAIRRANAVELGGTPESAIARVMERAVQKYGPQDWSSWSSAPSASRRQAARRCCASPGLTVRLTVCRNGSSRIASELPAAHEALNVRCLAAVVCDSFRR
jgi:hypothetical protein